jgi:hypothetical protein
MVIKTTFVHSGWSYGKSDDQYDNESLGSTRKVLTLKKMIENSSRNRKNEQVGIMCSTNKEEHTDEHGWTTIDNNSSRKPKKMNSNQTSVESIIPTIDIETKNNKNGAPEAQVNPPTRKIVCYLPEELVKQGEEKQENIKTKEQEKQTKKPPNGEETRIVRTTRKLTGKVKTTGHEKDKKANIGEGTRSITREVEGKTNKTQEHKRQTKHTTTTAKKTTTTITTGEENKVAGETEQNTTGTPERNQHNKIGRNNKDSNNNNGNNSNNIDENNNNNNNNKNTNREERDKSNNKEGGNNGTRRHDNIHIHSSMEART